MFTPKIDITGINITADKWTVADVTGVSPTDPTGYGQAVYLPSANNIWVKEVFAQYLGALPVNVPFNPSTDNVLPSAEMTHQLQDGVYIITEYFSRNVAGLDYNIDVTKKILTRTAGSVWVDPLGLFEGVFAVKKGAYTTIGDCSLVASLTSTTLTLVSAVPTVVNRDPLTVVYKASKYILVTTEGSNKLMQEIGDMASICQDCDTQAANSLIKKVMIQAAAKINFNCGNYSKAHNAAILLSKMTENSSDCGC